jgi:hypothetical protein
MRNLLMMMGAALCLAAVLAGIVAGPAGAQEGSGAGNANESSETDEATPVPTLAPPIAAPVTPAASPAAAPASPSTAAAIANDSSLPAPPAVMAGVYADPMTGGKVFPSGVCGTGYARGDLTPDGLELTVLGQCFYDAPISELSVTGKGLSIADGDVAVNMKVTNHADRARPAVYARIRDGKMLGASFSYPTGQIVLFKRDGADDTTLASRQDMSAVMDPAGWNRVALRVRGTEAWLLVNDVPVLYSDQAIDQAGGVGIELVREGSTVDEDDAVVVFKDLTLSSVTGSDPTRAPTYTP